MVTSVTKGGTQKAGHKKRDTEITQNINVVAILT
jgi:hypothetical protein